MREILFRGKAINRDKGYHRTEYKNGDWVYGLVTRLYDERFENLPAEMTDTSGVSGIEVDYKTIGRYTGLTDMNGTKIFEGDILCYEGGSDYAVVKYRDDRAAFFVENEDGEEYLGEAWDTDVIVVGNIYDNPELLKVE